MFEFDEDRPSITGRKISSNIPPVAPGYEHMRPWLKWIVFIYLGAVAVLFTVLALFG